MEWVLLFVVIIQGMPVGGDSPSDGDRRTKKPGIFLIISEKARLVNIFAK